MLRTVIWYASHFIAGYLFSHLLNSAFAFYDDAKWGLKKLEDARAIFTQEDDSEN